MKFFIPNTAFRVDFTTFYSHARTAAAGLPRQKTVLGGINRAAPRNPRAGRLLLPGAVVAAGRERDVGKSLFLLRRLSLRRDAEDAGENPARDRRSAARNPTDGKYG